LQTARTALQAQHFSKLVLAVLLICRQLRAVQLAGP
jgi:hypothetical protein